MSDDDPYAVIREYKKKFGDVPTMMGLGKEDFIIGVDALATAIADNQPFASDEEFLKAIGLEPPPPGALT